MARASIPMLYQRLGVYPLDHAASTAKSSSCILHEQAIHCRGMPSWGVASVASATFGLGCELVYARRLPSDCTRITDRFTAIGSAKEKSIHPELCHLEFCRVLPIRRSVSFAEHDYPFIRR